MRPARSSPSSIFGGIAGSLVVHGAIVAAAVALVMPIGTPNDEAAITIFVDPALPPLASARDDSRTPELEPEPLKDQPQTAQSQESQTEEPQHETAVAAPTPEPALRDAVPEPPAYDSLSKPDFKPPPRPAPPRPGPPKAAPQRAAPSPPASPTRPPVQVVPPASGPTQGGPGSAPPAPAATVAPGWNALLAAWLAAHRRFPDESRRRHEEGEVTVRFTVAADGRVTSVAIVQGSGFAALDGAALAMLQGAVLPPPGFEATRVVRVRYRLAD